MKIPDNVFRAAIQKYVKDKGGYDFYSRTIDHKRSSINENGEISLIQNGSGKLVSQYRIEDLEIIPHESDKTYANTEIPKDISPSFIFAVDLGDAQVSAGLISSFILLVSTFLPIATMPVVGTVNYIGNGRGDGVLVVIVAIASMLFILAKKTKWISFSGAISLVIIFNTFWRFQFAIADARTSLESLNGNPFKGIAVAALASIGMSWGWIFLIASSVSLIICAELVSVGGKVAFPTKLLFPTSKSDALNSIPIIIIMAAISGLALHAIISGISNFF